MAHARQRGTLTFVMPSSKGVIQHKETTQQNLLTVKIHRNKTRLNNRYSNSKLETTLQHKKLFDNDHIKLL